MQLLSDVALAALAIANSGECNEAFAVLSAAAAGQFAYRWLRRAASQAAQALPPQPRRSGGHGSSDELRAAIARLPVAQRQFVQLRFFEGRDLPDIAARTGLSCDEVKAVQYHALVALAGALKSRE